jgi:hypothetical protein
MGPYCKYCHRRCFLTRTLATGKTILLATCTHGMAFDRANNGTGQDHTTAHNPITDRFPCQPGCTRCQVRATYPATLGEAL